MSTRVTFNVPLVTKEGVRKALKVMKRRKAEGNDGITVVLLKEGGNIVLEKHTVLLIGMLEESKSAHSLEKGHSTLVHKTGNPNDLKNYRHIRVLSLVYKLFAKVIVSRIGGSLESHQPREQAGFSKGYSTMDHMHAVNQVIEKSAEYTKPLYVAFIGGEKAFDSLLTTAVLEALKGQGIQEAYLRLLEYINKGCNGRITINKQIGKFPISKGARQGETISPKLFITCLQGVFRKLDWENIRLRINGEYLSHLRFADDILLLSETAEHTQKMIEELKSESTAVRL